MLLNFSYQLENSTLDSHIDIDRIVAINFNLLEETPEIVIDGKVFKYENALSWRVNRHGQFDSQSYVDGIRFYASAGNIGSGHFDFYGVRRG